MSNFQPGIVVADASAILRSGAAAVLKRLPNLHVHPIEIASVAALQSYMTLHEVDVVIVNPSMEGWKGVAHFKERCPKAAGTRFVALMAAVMQHALLREYDEIVNIYDDVDTLAQKLGRILEKEEAESEVTEHQQSLSEREKEIIRCVVKGLTNKQIADELFISVHTVITHRRNIAQKLQIHSSAGLTIYAIVNKIVDVNELHISGASGRA